MKVIKLRSEELVDTRRWSSQMKEVTMRCACISNRDRKKRNWNCYKQTRALVHHKNTFYILWDLSTRGGKFSISVFWVMTLCTTLDGCQHFGATFSIILKANWTLKTCSMCITGHVSVCVLLYCMLIFHCLSLHVSNIHGHLQKWSLHIFIFIYLRSLLRSFFLCGHTLHVFHLCFVPVLFSFEFFGVFMLMHLSACSLLWLFVLCCFSSKKTPQAKL
jgi:hypothetical protein